MKCHQRQIREALCDDHPVPADMSLATVREITYNEAKSIILKYEWLGNMGTTVRSFGLFFDTELAGVACFGHPGSTAINNICGEENTDKVYWLARGACVPWAHPHSASYLITEACKQFGTPWRTREGREMPAKFVFVATADTDAGEIGTVYQASNWLYVGRTTSDRMFLKGDEPPEKAKSYRMLIKGALRIRTGKIATPEASGRRYFLIEGKRYYCGDVLPSGEVIAGSDRYPFRIKPQYGKTLKEAETARLQEILKAGYREVSGNPKHMYVGIYGDKRMRRRLLAALVKTPRAYPKRDAV